MHRPNHALVLLAFAVVSAGTSLGQTTAQPPGQSAAQPVGADPAAPRLSLPLEFPQIEG